MTRLLFETQRSSILLFLPIRHIQSDLIYRMSSSCRVTEHPSRNQ